MKEEFYKNMTESRDYILSNIIKVFKPLAIEAHLVGSLARGNPDAWSDIDFWVTIDDSSWEGFKEKRFELFSQVGNVIHLCEPPQNAPLGGIFSGVKFEHNGNIIVCDFYLCPLSTSFVTSESKNLFGNISLPLGELSLNPQKISVPETYRIDFFIGFIIGAIKLIARKKETPLELVLQQYDYLITRYEFNIKKLLNNNNLFETLKEVSRNIKSVSNEKQIHTLNVFDKFIDKVDKIENS